MSGYQHLTFAGKGLTLIFTYNPVSGYQHLTPASERSTLILTYNPVSGLTHIWSILKTLIFSHISQKQGLYKIE